MSWIDRKELTTEDIIKHSKPNKLYSHEFEKGRFFQVIHEDDVGALMKLAPRTMMKIIYLREKEDIEGFEITKLINGKTKQTVKLNKFNFQQLRDFLSFINTIQLEGVTERKLKLTDEKGLNEESIKSIKTLLSEEGGAEIVETLIDEGVISSKDIVNTSFRKRGLNIFKRLLEEKTYWKKYATENSISTYSEEKVWQYFFEKNQWIFGYGLDYKFQVIRQKEMHLSDTDGDGSSAVITDFLLADNNFTSFVELKKPSTPLFGKSQNRSNAWCLSNDLIDSVSQILEQKASGELWLQERERYDDGEPISQKTYDHKVILLNGNWDKIENTENTKEKEIKRKTLELFRKDSRNVEILTYDELYERAQFIALGEKDIPSINIEESSYDDNIQDYFGDGEIIDNGEDLPF